MIKRSRAVAWEHTMIMEDGQATRKLSYSSANPFGKPGVDYDSEYRVTSRKLIYAPKEQEKGK